MIIINDWYLYNNCYIKLAYQYFKINVFNFYVRLNPETGRYIYDIFKKNISDYYAFKHDILSAMDLDIRSKEKELEEKAKWLAP